jgi:two-component system sensor histidine kinase KdpD
VRPPLRQSVAHYALSVAGVAFVTTVLAPFQSSINSTTVALALLLAVLFAAALWGSGPALLASVWGVLCFNYFFLPPVHTFTIADPENWVALAAFLITAVTAGALSARARRRAEEAEAGRREIERLYKELRAAFERASHAEALRQSEKLKTALLDAVTHDLRTPLTSIKASITTLLDESDAKGDGGQAVALDDDERREMLTVINEESDRLNRFIGGLIELARIEAGEMRLRRNWGAAEEIIAAALARAEPLTRGHVIKTDIEAGLPVARVDARAVSEVIYTLVDNAAKYSPTGTTIRVEAARAGEDALQIAVEDEGRGIPVELRERVFDKFFRATRDGDVSTREPSGTGMGLAIARGIVEAHGGRIRVEDGGAGKGTRVAFTLPIGDDEANGGESSAEASDASDRIAAPSDDLTRAQADVEVSHSRVGAKP